MELSQAQEIATLLKTSKKELHLYEYFENPQWYDESQSIVISYNAPKGLFNYLEHNHINDPAAVASSWQTTYTEEGLIQWLLKYEYEEIKQKIA